MGKYVDIKFVIMLRRISEKDAEPALRGLFDEMKGCQVLSLVQRDRYITVVMLGIGFDESHSDKSLTGDIGAVMQRVRGLVALDSVRIISRTNTLQQVIDILHGKKK